MGSTAWTLPIKTDLVTVAAKCQICQQQRPTLSPRYDSDTFMAPKGTKCDTWTQDEEPVTLQNVDYIGYLFHGNTCPYWTWFLWFAFPAFNVSAKTSTTGLTECFTHHQGIPHSIASNQELTLQPEK